jgi:hypothetical protein
VFRGATGLAFAWVLSCAPLVLPALWPELAEALGDASRTALAAWPWIAWLGLPGRARTPGSAIGASRGSGWIATAALAAPALAAGAGLDLARGVDPRAVATLGLACAASIAALTAAAALASRSPARARAHAMAWLVLVPGTPMLAACLALGGAPSYGDPPFALAALARASPLGWIAGRALPAAADRPVLAGAAAAFGVCLVLLAVAGAGVARARAAEAGRTA